MGVRIVAQYALLGEWDFLNILEAPDAVTVAKVAIGLVTDGVPELALQFCPGVGPV